MSLIENMWNSFWVVVWVPPVAWTGVLLLDVFQTKHIFRNQFDGAIISSLFLAVPLLLFSSIFDVNHLKILDSLIIFIAGVAMTIHALLYFSALKFYQDVVIADSLNSMSIVLVTAANFVLFGVVYNTHGISAILIACVSASLFTLNMPTTNPFSLSLMSRKESPGFWMAFVLMMGSMLMLTISTVLSDYVYGNSSFNSGIILYSAGVIVGGLGLWLFNYLHHRFQNRMDQYHGIVILIKNNWKIFVIAESFSVISIVFFQRAISIGDVAQAMIIEAITPILVLIVAYVLVKILHNKNQELTQLYQQQIENHRVKVVAIVGMIFSIYLSMKYI